MEHLVAILISILIGWCAGKEVAARDWGVVRLILVIVFVVLPLSYLSTKAIHLIFAQF